MIPRGFFLLLLTIIPSLGLVEPAKAQGEAGVYQITWHPEAGKEKKLRADLHGGIPEKRLIPAVRRSVMTYCYRYGFFDAVIDSVRLPQKWASSKIDVYGRQGTRYRWKAINLISNDDSLLKTLLPPEQVREIELQCRVQQKAVYQADRLQTFMKDVINALGKTGYVFARAELRALDPDHSTNTVEARIRVTPGDRARIRGVIFEGRRYNDAGYLERIAGIPDSSIITDRVLERGREHLQNSDLFTRVGEAEIVKKGDDYYVAYPVVEKNINSFDLILGYVPREGRSNTIVGTGHLSLRNAVWNGSALDLSFDRLQQYVTRFEGGYHQGWIAGIPLGAGVRFRFFQQDSSYQQRSIRLGMDYQITATTELSAGIRREITAVSSQGELLYPVVNASLALLDFGLAYQNVDHLDNPTRGLQMSVTAETGFKWIDRDTLAKIPRQRIRYRSFHVDVQPYFPVLRRQVVTPSVHAFVLQAGPYFESDLYRFGGAESLRGYAEEQFSASRMVWADLEWRYLLEARSYAFLFGAAGTYYRPSMQVGAIRTPELVQRLYSFGLGFSIHTGLGQLRFTYAKSADDPIDNGKVHISIRGAF